jgi:hypothetical protein
VPNGLEFLKQNNRHLEELESAAEARAATYRNAQHGRHCTDRRFWAPFEAGWRVVLCGSGRAWQALSGHYVRVRRSAATIRPPGWRLGLRAQITIPPLPGDPARGSWRRQNAE